MSENSGSLSPQERARTKPPFSLADERDARLARIKAQIDAGEWGVPSDTLAGDLVAAEEQGLLCDCEATRPRREPPGYPTFAEQMERDNRFSALLTSAYQGCLFLGCCLILALIIYHYLFA